MTADIFIWTTGGRRISLVSPTVEDVAPELIAGPLSRLCRWTGHVSEFYCPTPEQRVLTADLRWLPAGDLRVGEELLGFDEHPIEPGGAGTLRRRFRPSQVTAAVPVTRRVIRLEMADGSTVRASEEHPWLVATKQSRNQKWCTAREISDAVLAGRRRYMHKFIDPWSFNTAREAGWLAGMYDGEGYLSVHNRNGTQLGVSQLPGIVLDEAVRALTAFGFDAAPSRNGDSGVVSMQMRGGWRAILRLLGSVRPLRLLDKFSGFLRSGLFNKQLDGQRQPLEIVRAYDEGEQICAGLETSSKTYLCEGFGAHNSVAQHCVVVSHLLTPEHALAGLLHDGSESYTGDSNSPMKALMRRAGDGAFFHVADRFDALISERYGVDLSHPDIHIADGVAAIFEARLLVGVPDDELAAWFGDLMPVAELLAMTLPASVGSMLAPLAPRDAEAAWLQRLAELKGTP